MRVLITVVAVIVFGAAGFFVGGYAFDYAHPPIPGASRAEPGGHGAAE